MTHALEQEFIHHQSGVISNTSHTSEDDTQLLFLLIQVSEYIHFIQVKGRIEHLMLDSQFFHVLV